MNKIDLKRVSTIVRLEGVKLTPAEVALEELKGQELAKDKEKMLNDFNLQQYELNR